MFFLSDAFELSLARGPYVRKEQVEEPANQNQVNQEDKRPWHVMSNYGALISYKSAGRDSNTGCLWSYWLADLRSHRVQRGKKQGRKPQQFAYGGLKCAEHGVRGGVAPGQRNTDPT